jgi:hypothetical protein
MKKTTLMLCLSALLVFASPVQAGLWCGAEWELPS